MSAPPPNPRFDQAAASEALDALRASVSLLKQQTGARVAHAAAMRQTWKGPYADQFFQGELPRMRAGADALIAEMLNLMTLISSASAAAAEDQKAYQQWQQQELAKQRQQLGARGH